MPSPGDLPDPGIETGSSALQVDSLPAELPGTHRHKQSYRLGNMIIILLLFNH